jgi:hypothetical protein
VVYSRTGVIHTDIYRKDRPDVRTRKGFGNPDPTLATGDLTAQTGEAGQNEPYREDDVGDSHSEAESSDQVVNRAAEKYSPNRSTGDSAWLAS